RKKTGMHTRLSCKIDYLVRSNHRDRSIASEFFTDDQSVPLVPSHGGLLAPARTQERRAKTLNLAHSNLRDHPLHIPQDRCAHPLLLPSVSRGAHLDGPILYARHLIELWKLDNPGDVVPLTRAFRPLDEKALEGAILRANAAEDYLGSACECHANDANDDKSQRDAHTLWNFPNAQILLSELRAVVWQAMLAGTLVTEA